MKSTHLYLLLLAFFMGLSASAQKGLDSADHYLKADLPFGKKFDRIYELCYASADIETDKCMRIMHKMHSEAVSQHDSMRISKSNFLIGYCYGNKENFVLSLEYYFKALPYAELHRDSNLLVPIYNNIGIAYSKQLQHKSAIVYFMKVVAIAENKNNKSAMGVSYNNIAIEYQNLRQFSLADKYLVKSYNIFTPERKEFLATIIMNRGVIRFEKGQYDSAMHYYHNARQHYLKYNDSILPAFISNNLGELHYKMHNYDSALYYLNYTITQIDTLNDKYSLRETYKHLSDVHAAMGNMSKAYYFLKKHSYLNSTILDNENLKRTLTTEANFKLLKKDNELKIAEKQRELDHKTNRMFYIFGSVVGVLLVVALVIAILRFREKKRANEILTEQKTRIEEQQNEITDSINYARNIQNSILPAKDYLEKTLKDYALFYQPRDIVGGDFYYVEQIGNHTYFGVIDCTGHGVPGGFMSMLGFNSIQKCLHDFNLKHPSEILDALSQLVVKHFTHQGKQALRDGMDMALCCIYEESGKTMMEFSGANNPCWIVSGKDGQVTELSPNKQPIGYFENFKPFSNIKIALEKGDAVYLFSDGYADQFGGPSGKKFKYSQLKSLLQINPNGMSMKEREKMLKETFTEWRSTYEQLDDVCVLGVRIV